MTFVGDETCLNYKSYLSMHTVENMVLKLEPCIVGKNCNVGALSTLMPGAKMEDGSNLLSMTLVLKGETVPQGEEWAGLPAWENTVDYRKLSSSCPPPPEGSLGSNVSPLFQPLLADYC